MHNSTLDRALKLAKILSPWILLPLGLICLLDFARLLINLIELSLAFFIIFHMLSIIAGIVVATLKPGYEEYLLSLRVTKYAPAFTWSYDLVGWLLEENKENKENKEDSNT